MIITKSNILQGLSPTVTTGASSDLPANLTNPNMSKIYRSSDSLRLTYEFGATETINYVAVAGVNIGAGDGFASVNEYSRARVYDGGTVIKTVNVIRDNCIVLYFTARTFGNLIVTLKNSNNINPICSYTAAGMAFEVPNSGEVSGYNRQFLNRSYKQKTTTNTIGAPVSNLRKRIPAKGSLNLPNMTKEFSEGEWQEFLDFANENLFFILEQTEGVDGNFSGLNPSAYLCYNIGKNDVKAHASTRKLNNIGLSFQVYNGL